MIFALLPDAQLDDLRHCFYCSRFCELTQIFKKNNELKITSRRNFITLIISKIG